MLPTIRTPCASSSYVQSANGPNGCTVGVRACKLNNSLSSCVPPAPACATAGRRDHAMTLRLHTYFAPNPTSRLPPARPPPTPARAHTLTHAHTHIRACTRHWMNRLQGMACARTQAVYRSSSSNGITPRRIITIDSSGRREGSLHLGRPRKIMHADLSSIRVSRCDCGGCNAASLAGWM